MSAQVSDWFESANYPEGRSGYAGWECFVRLKDDAPEWLRDAVREAHQGTLPNDWIFFQCRAACEAIDEMLPVDGDWLHDYVDGEVDIYTKERFVWAAHFCLTDTFSEAEERATELFGDEDDTAARLGVIQYCAIEFIAQTMLDAHINNRGVISDLSATR